MASPSTPYACSFHEAESVCETFLKNPLARWGVDMVYYAPVRPQGGWFFEKRRLRRVPRMEGRRAAEAAAGPPEGARNVKECSCGAEQTKKLNFLFLRV